MRAGQVVAVQVSAALLVAAAGSGPLTVAAALAAAAALVLLAWVRLGGRWLYQWLGVWLRYASRRHASPAGHPGALLTLVSPGARVEAAELCGDAAALVVDGYGLTAVLDIGDPNALLTEAARSLPALAGLLPTATPDGPRVRVQLLISGVPAPVARAGAAASATSYRQLTDGRLLGQERTLLAVRVLRDEGWGDDDLRRALSGAVRKVRRRLGRTPTRALNETALLRAVADLAQHDGAGPAREVWQEVHLGELSQVTFRLDRWPGATPENAGRLVPRLLALPAEAVTVAVSAGPARPVAAGDIVDVPVDLLIRLTCGDAVALAGAAEAMRRLLAAEGATLHRLDGEQLDGFAATLPIGGPDADPLPGTAGPAVGTAAAVGAVRLPVGAAGLMVGTNRHGAPVLARLFRAEPTRAMVVGGARVAQLLTIRAMALGAQVRVHTTRPQRWEPFVRAVGAPGEAIAIIPPGRPLPTAGGTPLHPLLLVLDVGPVPADGLPGGGWAASLVVRDELAPVDCDALARADLVVLQRLRPDEATTAGATLGLGESANWLSRIRPDMVGVVNRRLVRWALLALTPIEQQLIGPPERG